jgi:phospholipase/lecithinase/hemolysin
MRAIRLSSLALALLGGTALATAANPAGAADITVFGDSYSQVPRLKFPNWVTQLQQDDVVDDVDNFAKSGATAANVGTNTLLRQTKLWKNAGKPVNDYVVVFFGINDIRKFNDIAKSRSGYKSALQEFEKAGANLVLVQVPDLGRVPEFAGTGQSAKLTSKTNTWNKFVKQRADEFDGQLVNLFNIFPGSSQAFDPDLFQDELHPNEEGQGLIAAAIGAKLGSSSKVARSLELSNKIAKTRTADAQSGLAFALATMPEGNEQLNLIAFPVGDGALTEAEGASDPGRSSFADVYGLDDRDGGAGVNYTLPDGTMLGIVISTYGDSQQDTVDFGASTSTVTSEQVAFYIDKKLGAFSLGTRFGYSRDRHEIENFDDFSGSHDSAAFDGRTLELAQRIGLPQAHEGFTLTP